MLSVILVILLLIIAYQDLQQRSVQWILMAIAAGITFAIGVIRLPVAEVLTYTLINLLFILVQVGLLTAYLLVRFKTNVQGIFSSYIGLGDILFWIGLAPLFSTMNFICFHLVSMLVSLVFFLLLKKFNTRANVQTVPLAGLQALFYTGVFIAVWCGWKYDFYNDLVFLDLI